MPTLGGASPGEQPYFTSFFGSSIAVQNSSQGPFDLYVTPLVPDYTEHPGAAAGAGTDRATLRDFTEGQDWLLKRLVGRLNVGVTLIQSTLNDTPPFILVGAGFYVGRADEGSPDIPDTNNSEIDPLASQNIRQPWLWRRTWLLRNGLAAPAGFDIPTAPVDNGEMPGALGPIIDSKVARRIRREERLWFVINAYGGDTYQINDRASSYGTAGNVQFNLDYRILGAMRRSNNRSTF